MSSKKHSQKFGKWTLVRSCDTKAERNKAKADLKAKGQHVATKHLSPVGRMKLKAKTYAIYTKG